MKSSAKRVELASVDDLFSTEESRADAQREKVLEIPLSELHPFKDHPFKVKDDDAMMRPPTASGSTACWSPPSPVPTPTAAMSWSPDTGGTGPVSWRARIPCR